MLLSDPAIRNAKPQAKPVKLFDSGGLFLLVTPNGGKWWRLKYRFGGKEKLLSLGTYPQISLKEARNKRDEDKKKLANGVDPSAARIKNKIETRLSAASTFGAVADELLAKKAKKLAEITQNKLKAILDNDLRPWLGNRPINDISAPELLDSIRRIESRGANELAHRALRLSAQVFQYAIVTGRVERNPAADLRGALEPVVSKHHAAITDPKQVGELLRAIDGYTGTLSVKCAITLAPLLFVRPGELRQAEWSEIDLDKAEWNIPAERMKMREAHLVPLSTQAIRILKELQPLTGHGRYVFPSLRTGERPMSENTVNAALRRLGFQKNEMTGHGFRAMARTILDEVLGFRPDFIEHQLAHAVKDPLGRAYNRTTHLSERRKMMQGWADYLDKLKTGAEVIPLHSQAA
jgi:integrase